MAPGLRPVVVGWVRSTRPRHGRARRRDRLRRRADRRPTWRSRRGRSSARTPWSTPRSSTGHRGCGCSPGPAWARTWSTSTRPPRGASPWSSPPAAAPRAVAEGVLAHTLALVKRVAPLTDAGPRGPVGRAGRRWPDRRPDGATIGIIGYGRIGRRVGELAAAFGMRVLAYDPFAPPPEEVACADLGELAAASDVLTLHVPLTAENHHLVDAAFLARTKPGAVLVNCGRGGLLDLDAALAALESGQLAGVGLDVFESEPPVHHPIFDHPSVSLTPHLMGLTRAARTDLRGRRAGRRRRPLRPEAAAVANPDSAPRSSARDRSAAPSPTSGSPSPAARRSRASTAGCRSSSPPSSTASPPSVPS